MAQSGATRCPAESRAAPRVISECRVAVGPFGFGAVRVSLSRTRRVATEGLFSSRLAGAGHTRDREPTRGAARRDARSSRASNAATLLTFGFRHFPVSSVHLAVARPVASRPHPVPGVRASRISGFPPPARSPVSRVKLVSAVPALPPMPEMRIRECRLPKPRPDKRYTTAEVRSRSNGGIGKKAKGKAPRARPARASVFCV